MRREDLELSLQFADASHRRHLPRHRVARWLRAALEAPARITVRIVGEVEGRALNRDYRGQDHATNVLTFDYRHEPAQRSARETAPRDRLTVAPARGDAIGAPAPREPVVVADLVLCAPVVEREARAEGKTLAAHYAHLLVHGALHAQGHDHQRPPDARRMEARESELLLALGHADPYAR